MKTDDLDAIADLSIAVIGKERSISPHVAMCVKILRHAGLRTLTHALGTNVEGPLDRVLGAIGECHRQLHAAGLARLVSNITIATRTDRTQTIEEKIAAVTSKVEP